MSKRYSTADVAAHKTADDLYIIVDDDVYDLTKFADEHPGGKKSTWAQQIARSASTNMNKSSRVLLAKMRRSSFGSTTMRVFSESIRNSCK